MSQNVVRLLIALSGALVVESVLLVWLLVRRRRRSMISLTSPRSQKPETKEAKVGKQLIAFFLSVAASVVSGIVLFMISPMFTNPSTGVSVADAVPNVGQLVSTLNEGEDVGQPEGAVGAVPATAQPVDQQLPDLTPRPQNAIEPEKTARPEQEVPSGVAAVVEAPRQIPRIQIEGADNVANLGLEPLTHSDAYSGDANRRILTAGSSTSEILMLQPFQDFVSHTPRTETRIRLDGAETYDVFLMNSPQTNGLLIQPRVRVEDAAASKLLSLVPPNAGWEPVVIVRPLIEGASTIQLMNLQAPESVALGRQS